jgi:tetratricopeptide (TPR) repeat protein
MSDTGASGGAGMSSSSLVAGVGANVMLGAASGQIATRREEAVWDVFLSYASSDLDRARELYEELRERGLRVFFDHNIAPGRRDSDLTIPKHLRSSSVVLILVGADTHSAQLQTEEIAIAARLARSGHNRLIPVRLGPEKTLPYGAEQLQSIDMWGSHDVEEVGRVVADLVRRTSSTLEASGQRVFSPVVPDLPSSFVGRDDLLNRLLTGVRSGATGMVVQAIAGLGGMGKTTLAAAVANAARSEIDLVWWIRAGDPQLLIDDIASLAPHIGIAPDEDPFDTAVAVRRHLGATDKSFLLVFDDARDLRSIREWFPQGAHGALLVTSRSSTFTPVDTVVYLDPLSNEEARQLLLEVGALPATASSEDVSSLVEQLGGLPLALKQAAAYVRHSGRSFNQLAALLDDAAHIPFPDGAQPSRYEHAVATTWRVALDRAATAAPLARQLLFVLSFYASVPIPRAWVLDMADDPYLGEEGSAAASDAVTALAELALISLMPEDAIGVHSLIQSLGRRSAPKEAEAAAIRLLRRQSPENPNEYLHWPLLALLTPHVLALTSHVNASLPESAPDLWWLLDDVATYQRASGAVHEAVTTAEVANRLALKHLGMDDVHTLISRNNLAIAYLSAGNLGLAIPLLEASVADRLRVLGSDHPDTLASRSDLAGAYAIAGDLTQAISLLEGVLDDRQRVLGPDHAETLRTRNELADAYWKAGDAARSIEFSEAVLNDAERVLGPRHPATLTSRSNLAIAHMSAGHFDRAIPLLESALSDRERVLGPDHPEALASRRNLAIVYASAGDLNRAIPLFEAVLSDSERVLGPDHPDTLASRNNLASAYLSAGDVDRATSLLEGALADRQRVLGLEHPDTMTTCRNLASAYTSAGNFDRAIPLFEAVLSDSERVLGPDHPDTLATRSSLAGAYLSTGDLSRAILLLEATLADSERVLGSEHPATISSRRRLARAYMSTGDLSRAVLLLEAALADSERVLGPEHPDTIANRENLEAARAAVTHHR